MTTKPRVVGLRSTFREGVKAIRRHEERRRLRRFVMQGCGWTALIGLALAGFLFIITGIMGAWL